MMLGKLGALGKCFARLCACGGSALAPDIELVGVAVPASTTNSTSLQITYPAAVQAGDVMYMLTVNDGANADPSIGDTDTGGNAWAAVSGSGTGITVWRKAATSGTAGKVMTASGFTTGCSAGLVAYRNAGDHENVVNEALAAGDETIGGGGITPTASGAMVCFFVGNRAGGAVDVSNVAGASLGAMEQRFEHLNSTGGCSVHHSSALQAVAGATGDITWQQANAATRAFVLDILRA